MESIPVSRKRIRHQRRKRHGKNKRNRLKLEVRSLKRQKSVCNIYVTKDKLVGKSMEAKAFWENYATAQEWQQTHNVIWWRTRCQALEHENEILRNTVRNLARTRQCHCQRKNQVRNEVPPQCQSEVPNEFQTEARIVFQNEDRNDFQSEAQNQFQNGIPNEIKIEVRNDLEEAEAEFQPASDDESLEFELNDDMMDFLKQSMKHKMELKQKREEVSEEEDNVPFRGGAVWMQERTKNAKLLYGEASQRILGMETALQTTIDGHKVKARPQYWPNIPLKL